jgi:hypothetical protein
VIDAEVRRIVEQSHVEADRLLAAHRDELDALAKALLKEESLNEKEIRKLTGLAGPHIDEDESSGLQLSANSRTPPQDSGLSEGRAHERRGR